MGGVVVVEHRDRVGREHPEEVGLRVEVLGHRPVVVEVVAPEAVKTAQSKRTESSHPCTSACDDTSIAQARIPASSISRSRKWTRSAPAAAWARTSGRRPAAVPDGLEHADAHRARALERGLDQERRRRLPVRAGDADDAEEPRRPAPEAVGEERERPPRVLREQDRDAALDLRLVLGDDRDGAALDRVLDQHASLAAETLDGDEQIARADALRVGGDASDLHVGKTSRAPTGPSSGAR